MITRGNPQTHRNSPESSRQEWNVGAKISCSCEFVVKTTQIRYKNHNPVSHKSSRNYSSSQTKLPLSPSPWALYLKPSNPHMFKLSQRLPWQESSQQQQQQQIHLHFYSRKRCWWITRIITESTNIEFQSWWKLQIKHSQEKWNVDFLHEKFDGGGQACHEIQHTTSPRATWQGFGNKEFTASVEMKLCCRPCLSSGTHFLL